VAASGRPEPLRPDIVKMAQHVMWLSPGLSSTFSDGWSRTQGRHAHFISISMDQLSKVMSATAWASASVAQGFGGGRGLSPQDISYFFFFSFFFFFFFFVFFFFFLKSSAPQDRRCTGFLGMGTEYPNVVDPAGDLLIPRRTCTRRDRGAKSSRLLGVYTASGRGHIRTAQVSSVMRSWATLYVARESWRYHCATGFESKV